ncbi:uncharacterized protein LOC131329309 isoform X4 [Rhododendron vialii]|uniref:uncharacterized protein LOC131329309 isoform X4 n=1 Tax=Rhododendron vialii TaxID=182163 RepID=UPI00265EEB4B|nr:uncharacterized protein LOC131329309 isoform X4 [Rhododendron vialii]
MPIWSIELMSFEICTFWSTISDVCRFGNLIRITKDGFRLLSWLYLRKRAIQFMWLLGHQILAGNIVFGRWSGTSVE